MQDKPCFKFMLFYSNYNPQSLRVKIAMQEIIAKLQNIPPIKISEINFDYDKMMCKKYNIFGLPTLLIFRNNRLQKKYFGELDRNDFETIILDLVGDDSR